MVKLAFFNNKGGTGKSTSTINVAHAMTRLGKRVIVVDCDNQRNTFRFFADSHQSDYEKAKTRYENLDIVLGKAYQKDYDNEAIEDWSKDYDYAIFDCPPALNETTEEILSYCDYVFVPFELGRFAIQGIAKVTESIAASGVKFGGCFINKFDRDNPASHKLEGLLRNELGNRTMKMRIPSSRVIKNSIDYGETAFEYMGWAEAAGAYTTLTKEIMKICKGENQNA
jgi:chromosome partitioning protein